MILRLFLLLILLFHVAVPLAYHDLAPSSRVKLERTFSKIEKLNVEDRIKSVWRALLYQLVLNSTTNTNFKKRLKVFNQKLLHKPQPLSVAQTEEGGPAPTEVQDKPTKDFIHAQRDYERILRMKEDFLPIESEEALTLPKEMARQTPTDARIETGDELEGEGEEKGEEEEKEEEEEEETVPVLVKKPKRKRKRGRKKRGAARKFEPFAETLSGERSARAAKKDEPAPHHEKPLPVKDVIEALAEEPEEETASLLKYLPFYDDKDEEPAKSAEIKELQKNVEELKEKTQSSITEDISNLLYQKNVAISEKLENSTISTCLVDLYNDMLDTFAEMALKSEKISLSDLEKFRKIQTDSLTVIENEKQLKKQVHILNNLFRSSLHSSFDRIHDLDKCRKKGSGKKISPIEVSKTPIDTCTSLKRDANDKELFADFADKFVKRIEAVCGSDKNKTFTPRETKKLAEFRSILDGARKRRAIFAENKTGNEDFIERMNTLKTEIVAQLNQDKDKNPCSNYYNRMLDYLMIRWYGAADEEQLGAIRKRFQHLKTEIKWIKSLMNDDKSKRKF